MTVYLVLGITFGFAAAVQPGPLQTFLISRALCGGWRQTLPAACAPILSDGPIMVLALVVLTSLPAGIEHFLHIAGGFFVLFLALGAFRSYRNYRDEVVSPAQSSRKNLFQAVFINLLNPNPYLAWSLVMGPLFLQGWREAPPHGVSLLAGFYFAMIFFNAGIIVLFAAMRRFGPRISRILLGISALALTGFGIYQLWLGISSIAGK